MRIKAKMLLPRPEIDEQGNEIDPRQDLVQRLLLYKQYKAACEDLRVLEDDRAMKSERGNIQRELATIAMQNSHAEELMNLNLYQLLNTFNKVIKRFDDEKHKVHHKIVQYPYTISEQKSDDTSDDRGQREITFAEVILACQNKVQAIFTFLGILELSRNKFSALRLVLASIISG